MMYDEQRSAVYKRKSWPHLVLSRLIPVKRFQNYGDAEGEETEPEILYKEIFIFLLTEDEKTEFVTNALHIFMGPRCMQNL
jgi:hypothetical protein